MSCDIRIATQSDIPALVDISRHMQDHHGATYFKRALAQRTVFIATTGPHNAGYVHLNFSPAYAYFRQAGIPEIQDLCVVPDHRKQGIGTALVHACMQHAKEKGHMTIGISVALPASFGAAQRLYTGMGFMPDGFGATYDDIPLKKGDIRPVDALLTLKMIHSL